VINGSRPTTSHWTARLAVPAIAALALVSALPAAPGHAAAQHRHHATASRHHRRPLGTLTHPRNVRPKPDFFEFCGTHSPNNPHCIALELAAIRHARKIQHFATRPLVLPHNYRTLSFARQTFVLTDLERVDRGLRPFSVLTAALNARAFAGARSGGDPTVGDSQMRQLGLQSWQSLWAEDLGPLATDYDWMYDDGFTSYGPRVTDCHYHHDTGCWDHRDAILARYRGRTLLAGAATTERYAGSIAEVLSESNSRPLGRIAFTWRAAVRAGADHR
jgi:hypothetical protein